MCVLINYIDVRKINTKSNGKQLVAKLLTVSASETHTALK